jgi:type II secretory pathway pseudopilin PulG
VIVRELNRKITAFTLAELLVAVGVLGMFTAALLTTWSAVGYSALNTTTYTRRQNDQMRILDYLKRDIRRATKVELYNGSIIVAGTNIPASELKLTIPDYYADSREDDDSRGGANTPIAPTITGDVVSYGSPLTVRYSALGGAGIRKEQGVSRTVADAAGAFSLSFKRQTNGTIRCSVIFDQPMRGSGNTRVLHRQVDTLCLPRTELHQ